MLKIDMGCGGLAKEGFVGLDTNPASNLILKCDFSKDKLPFADSTVEEVYSSHCFEHLDNIPHVLQEIVRVCKNGAHVLIVTPHFTSPMAMCAEHKMVWSENQWGQICVGYPHRWFDLAVGQIKLKQFMYNGLNVQQLPHFSVQYYHEFALEGFVSKK